MDWLPQTSNITKAKVSLVCLPYAGGGTAIYHQWRASLDESIELLPVRLPGRESRLNEPPYEDLSRLADDLHDGLADVWQRPFALFGHSMGAVIAYELARKTTSSGTPPVGLFASACRPPDQLQRNRGTPLHTLPDEEMILALLRLYGMESTISADERALMLVLSATLRADLKLLETYQFDEHGPVSCPIVAMGGADDSQVSRADLEGWQSFTNADASVRVFPGGHFFLRQQQEPVVGLLTRRLWHDLQC